MNCFSAISFPLVVLALSFAPTGWADTDHSPAKGLNFANDILPILSRAGCNAGSCHAKPEGQNGFKLSVFGYDPKSDYQAIVESSRSRRVSPGAPEASLLLLKPTMTLNHGGGKRLEVNSDAYRTLVQWIREGVPYAGSNAPILLNVTVTPSEGTYTKTAVRPLHVEARYSDGTARDVTQLTNFRATEAEIADVTEDGVIKTGSVSGEGVIIARYMGQVGISRVTVPADHLLPNSLYASLPVNNPIDPLVYAQLKKLGIEPSAPCTDAEFIRRASLDSIGTLPRSEEIRAFLADKDPKRRDKLIDRLLDNPAYADYWATKWGDLIRPNPFRVGVKPVYLLDLWLRESFRENKPYNQFVRELLTAEGSTHKYGPLAVFRDRREPEDATTLVSQIFLGTRLECARCHHHPNEKWAQEDFYQFAAFFGSMKRKGQGISTPISGEPEFIFFSPGGEVKHPLTGEVMKPRVLDGETVRSDSDDPREALADWLCRPDNPFFARAIVNRIWADLLGRGIVHPVDDFRVSNLPSNTPLLDWLAHDFVEHGFDLKHLMRTVMRSQVYQLSSLPNRNNVTDNRYFSRSYRRRLPAEVLLDAVCEVTGTTETFQGVPPGFRAIQTWNNHLDSEFLDAFGRPNSSADCPCERETRPSVVQALHLMNSNRLQSKIANTDGRAKKLAQGPLSPEEIVTELYFSTYCRAPESEELKTAAAAFSASSATRQTATEDVMWALLNSAEFVFNH